MENEKIESAFKEKLKKLRKDLKGNFQAVADECQKDISTVSRILNGEWFDENVIEKAIEVRDRLHKEHLDKLKEFANKI